MRASDQNGQIQKEERQVQNKQYNVCSGDVPSTQHKSVRSLAGSFVYFFVDASFLLSSPPAAAGDEAAEEGEGAACTYRDAMHHDG